MAATTTDATLRVPNDDEVDWRLTRLSKLGHEGRLALEIAGSAIDLHDFERMLAAGCPLDLAWHIRKPFEWEVPAAEQTRRRLAAEREALDKWDAPNRVKLP